MGASLWNLPTEDTGRTGHQWRWQIPPGNMTTDVPLEWKVFKWLFNLGGSYCLLFPIIHVPWGGHKAPICKVFSKGHQFQRACSRSPQALTLLESAKQCQPRPLFPRDASLRSVWVEVTSHLSRAQGPGPSAQAGWRRAGFSASMAMAPGSMSY